jgi:hypothetical protein
VAIGAAVVKIPCTKILYFVTNECTKNFSKNLHDTALLYIFLFLLESFRCMNQKQ